MIVAIGLYCSCGNAMEGKISPASLVPKLEAAWRQVHSGDGHSDTTREKCMAEMKNQEGK
jgi:DNA-binding transcriptional regulator YdaS (Cro superfamily)